MNLRKRPNQPLINPRPKNKRKIVDSTTSEDSEEYSESLLSDLSNNRSSLDSSTEESISCTLGSDEQSDVETENSDIEETEESVFEELEDTLLDKKAYDPDYFVLDPNLLINHILRNIEIEADALNLTISDDIIDIITKSVTTAKTAIIHEYTAAVPKDVLWKTECETEDEIQGLEKELARVRLTIRNKLPTLSKILKADIPDKDKIEAVQLYDITKNMEPFTLLHHETIKDIIKILDLSGVIPTEELKLVEEDEKRLNYKKVPDDISLKLAIYKLDIRDEAKVEIYRMYEEYMSFKHGSDHRAALKEKLLWAINLPHKKLIPSAITESHSISDVKKYCSEVYEKLDAELYGMVEIKEKLMQTVLNKVTNPHTKSMLGLCSPPGRGKTAIASALAKAMDLPFERISLGGMIDPSVLKGSNGVWVGASPSILLHILRRMKISNGIVLFDELDKLSESERGKEIQYALLHITDYIQNKEFQDAFISEFSHDLSNIWFMFAMNSTSNLDPALRDRLDIHHIDPYTQLDINQIIVRHFLPNAIKNAGLPENSITISERACIALQCSHTSIMQAEGLRPIDKFITDLVSKINLYNVWKSDDTKTSFKLSFNLPNFRGLPYIITQSTIESNQPKERSNTSFLSMYS